MLIDKLAALAGAAALALFLASPALFLASPASALTMAECSVKYNAAKEAGSLDGQTWNQFRKAECGSDATAASDSKPTRKTKKSAAKTSDDSEGTGLSMAECSAKYRAAKDAGTLNGMKWNDFRKAECGPGASARTVAAKKSSKKSSSSGDSQAKGLSMAECSAKYQAAKDADALNGMKWNDFRKAECGPGASARTVAVRKSSKSSSGEMSGKGLTMAECSARYQAAKSAGTLDGMKWNAFRKAECGANAADDDTVPAADEATYTGDPVKPSIRAPHGVKFPNAISRKYSDEMPGKARMHTCLDQYYANKDADALNGLRWIQKGGGYYSLCNARLKS